jgi:Fe-S oxidoreductase
MARVANAMKDLPAVRRVNQCLFDIDRRRNLPAWSRHTFEELAARRTQASADVLVFRDTFTNYYDPEIGIAALDVMEAGGLRVGVADNGCCGRPLISKGLLAAARERARENVSRLYETARAGRPIVFCEPSCLSAVREDAPSLLRGEEQRKARVVAGSCVSFEEFVEAAIQAGRIRLELRDISSTILLHSHCHQKAMGLLPVVKALLSRLPRASVVDPQAGCCGMAGSFGYSREHFDVSRQIGERRLFPAIRNAAPGTVVVAPGFSCRHQIKDFTSETAIHPAVLLQSRLVTR